MGLLALLITTTAMLLHVRAYDTRIVDTLSCPTVADLKLFLAENDGFPLESIQLHRGTNMLGDQDDLNNLPQDSAVDVIVPMLGGKVHGSLARAGKVRGQTPKVEKQEKRKKPTGRAKRRIQYNRRFVNVVATFGRKKGP